MQSTYIYNVFLRILFLLYVVLFAFTAVDGQEPCDLYLLNLHQTRDGLYHVYGPKYLSDFNPGGYTNQPYFMPSGEILVSVKKAGESQHDIYQISPFTKKYKRITKTETNEFSPRLDPDQKKYSVLRQVIGDSTDQRIFQFSRIGEEYATITPDIRHIGYYAWVHKDQLVMFLLDGDQHRLVSYSISEQKARRITSGIGRSLWSADQESVWFVHKLSDEYWYVKKYNTATSTMDVLATTPGKTEDFAIAPDQTIFMGFGSKLFYLPPGENQTWKECADLSLYNLDHITRLAISADGKYLALVNQPNRP
jgi:Tol biopolymer transport system component